MQNGVVIFEGVKPPDGTAVDVAEVEIPKATVVADNRTPEEKTRELSRALLELARNAEQVLPTDASLNVDHYLYGHPKR